MPLHRSTIIFIAFHVSALAIMAGILYEIFGRGKPNPCEMSYSWPNYREVRVESNFSHKYRLFRFVSSEKDYFPPLTGHPLLYVPGNAGSFQQVRSIGDQVDSVDKADVFTIDFNGELSAISGGLLRQQSEFVSRAVEAIAEAYSSPPFVNGRVDGKRPRGLAVVAHSMGGMVSLSAMVRNPTAFDSILFLSAPLVVPPFGGDEEGARFYVETRRGIRGVRRRRGGQRRSDDEENEDDDDEILLISVAGGYLDFKVPSFASILPADVFGHEANSSSNGDGLNVSTLHSLSQDFYPDGVSTDHEAILWCRQITTKLSSALAADMLRVGRGVAKKNLTQRRAEWGEAIWGTDVRPSKAFQRASEVNRRRVATLTRRVYRFLPTALLRSNWNFAMNAFVGLALLRAALVLKRLAETAGSHGGGVVASDGEVEAVRRYLGKAGRFVPSSSSSTTLNDPMTTTTSTLSSWHLLPLWSTLASPLSLAASSLLSFANMNPATEVNAPPPTVSLADTFLNRLAGTLVAVFTYQIFISPMNLGGREEGNGGEGADFFTVGARLLILICCDATLNFLIGALGLMVGVLAGSGRQARRRRLFSALVVTLTVTVGVPLLFISRSHTNLAARLRPASESLHAFGEYLARAPEEPISAILFLLLFVLVLATALLSIFANASSPLEVSSATDSLHFHFSLALFLGILVSFTSDMWFVASNLLYCFVMNREAQEGDFRGRMSLLPSPSLSCSDPGFPPSFVRDRILGRCLPALFLAMTFCLASLFMRRRFGLDFEGEDATPSTSSVSTPSCDEWTVVEGEWGKVEWVETSSSSSSSSSSSLDGPLILSKEEYEEIYGSTATKKRNKSKAKSKPVEVREGTTVTAVREPIPSSTPSPTRPYRERLSDTRYLEESQVVQINGEVVQIDTIACGEDDGDGGGGDDGDDDGDDGASPLSPIASQRSKGKRKVWRRPFVATVEATKATSSLVRRLPSHEVIGCLGTMALAVEPYHLGAFVVPATALYLCLVFPRFFASAAPSPSVSKTKLRRKVTVWEEGSGGE